jgi:AcrR family transcriptional regulator
MAFKASVETTGLKVDFGDKSFKVDGMTQNIFVGDLDNPMTRDNIAQALQEIFDRGRGKRRNDKIEPNMLSFPTTHGDIEHVIYAEAKTGFHYRVGELMEELLERLDATYGEEAMKPEDQHQVRVGMLAGVIAKAMDMGRVRGLDEAVDRLKKTILGEATV